MKKILILTLLLCVFCFAKNSISKANYETLKKCEKLINEKQYELALKTLIPLQETNNNYEKSFVYQSMASIYLNQENYKKTIVYYEKILNLNALNEQQLSKIKYITSQMYLSNSKYKNSIQYAQELIDNKFIKQESVYQVLLQANYYDAQYFKSIEFAKKLLKQSKDKKESWYKILLSSYIETKQIKKSILTLNTMLLTWNTNEQYWMQLASLHQKNKETKKALSTLEIAYKNNVITKKNNLLYYINLLLNNELYYKSASIMKQSIKDNIIPQSKKNFELIVSSYINAKEPFKAINTIKNSSFKNKTKYQLILANLYYENQLNKKSVQVLKSIKIKKETKLKGEKLLLLALNYYEMDKKDLTLKTLKKASKIKYTNQKAKNIMKQLGLKT